MGVANGDAANQVEFNSSFMSRETDTSTVGKIDLNNPSTASVTDIQKSLNGQASYSGADPNGADDQKPSFNNNDIGSATDNLKQRVDAVQAYSQANNSQILDILATLPNWQKFEIDYTLLSDPSNQVIFPIFVAPVRQVIHSVQLRLITEFTAPLLTDLDFKIGIAGSEDLFIPNFSGAQAADQESFYASEYLHFCPTDTTQEILLQVDSVGDTLDNLTAGSIEIQILKSVLP